MSDTVSIQAPLLIKVEVKFMTILDIKVELNKVAAVDQAAQEEDPSTWRVFLDPTDLVENFQAAHMCLIPHYLMISLLTADCLP